MKIRIQAVLFIVSLAGLSAARADDATNRVTAPREYTNRVQLYQVDLNIKKPEGAGASNLGIDQPGPSSAEAPDMMGIQQPTVFIPPARPLPERKKDKNWMNASQKDSASGRKKDTKDSGWGWLADDVSKAEKEREGKSADKRDDKEQTDQDASQDSDEDADDDVANRSDNKSDPRTRSYISDTTYDSRLAPDFYRDARQSSQSVARAEGSARYGDVGDRADFDLGEPAKSLAPGPSALDRVDHSAAAPAGVMPTFGAVGQGLGAVDDHPSMDDSGFTPFLSTPTPVPGEASSYQAVSPAGEARSPSAGVRRSGPTRPPAAMRPTAC